MVRWWEKLLRWVVRVAIEAWRSESSAASLRRVFVWVLVWWVRVSRASFLRRWSSDHFSSQ